MEIDEKYLIAFFGKNADYYLHKWREWEQGRRISFNAAAFFAGLLWFIYRRMYWVVGLILLLILVENEVEQQLVQRFAFPLAPENQTRTVVFNLLLATCFSAFGNCIYLSYTRRKIQRVLQRETSEEAILRQLRRRGGVSWTAILVCLVLFVGLLWIAVQYAPQPQ